MLINYVNLLEKKVESYKNRYKKYRPIAIFSKTVWWSITYFIGKIVRSILNFDKKEKDKLFIGISTGGGFGDYLLAANYIMYLRKYIGDCNIQLDCYTGSINCSEAIFVNSGLVDNIYKNRYHRMAKKYDLYYSIIEPFPNVIWVNRKKIERLCPQLLTLVDEYLKNEDLIGKTIRFSPKNNTQAYIASMIQGRNRVQMNDVGGILGVKPVIDFTPTITLDEKETLKKFGLENKKFITLNRCVSEINLFWDSNKMWSMDNYKTLVNMIKENYKDYTIVQIGHSVERSPLIEGIDMSLVGKTNLEEAKVIIKNSTLHIDGEGGLVHLRHALKGGTSIVLFGPTSVDFYGYDENINISTNKCYYPCDWVINDWQTNCLNKDKHVCMNTITPNMVFEKVVSELEQRKAGV